MTIDSAKRQIKSELLRLIFAKAYLKVSIAVSILGITIRRLIINCHIVEPSVVTRVARLSIRVLEYDTRELQRLQESNLVTFKVATVDVEAWSVDTVSGSPITKGTFTVLHVDI